MGSPIIAGTPIAEIIRPVTHVRAVTRCQQHPTTAIRPHQVHRLRPRPRHPALEFVGNDNPRLILRIGIPPGGVGGRSSRQSMDVKEMSPRTSLERLFLRCPSG